MSCRRGADFSVGVDERANLTEATLADAAHNEEVLDPAEGAVALAVLDDARGEHGADARQPLKLCLRSAVDGDGRRALIRRLSRRDFIAGGRGAAGQFDARRGEGREGQREEKRAEDGLQNIRLRCRRRPPVNGL